MTTPTIMTIAAVIIFFGLVAFYLASLPYGAFLEVFPVVISLIFILPLLAHYWKLRMIHYAVTDQRVLALSGRFSKTSVSVRHEEITTIEVHEPWLMGKIFGIGSIRFSVPSFSYHTVPWSNIKQAQETLNFIIETRRLLEQHRAFTGYVVQAGMIGGAVAGNLGQSKLCWNCKSSLRPTARFCRVCGVQQP